MLDVLDLAPPEQAAYEALLDNSPMASEEISAAAGVDPAVLRETLGNLEILGLISRAPGSHVRYRAVAPELALDLIALRKETALKEARRYIARLSTRFHEATAKRDPAELVEIVTGRRAIGQRFEQTIRSAREQFRFIDRPPYAMVPGTLTAAESDLLRQGVPFRGIYDANALLEHPLHSDMEANIALGEQARVLPEAPVKMGIADDQIACLPLQVMPTTIESAVIVHRSGLLEALCVLFETLWAQALPLPLPGGESSTPGLGENRPSGDEQRILALLVAGLSDDSIARQLAMSSRTVQRRLHDLMERLGARTRFQAGVKASLLGWIDLPQPHLPNQPRHTPKTGHPT